MRRLALVLFALSLLSGSPARGEPGLLVGVTEDGLQSEPEPAVADARGLGIDAFRITIRWRSGLTEPTPAQAAELERATRRAAGVEVVLSVFGERAADAPTTEEARDEYCGFIEQIVRRFRPIRSVSIWNEPNKSFFWIPQFDEDGTSAAPEAYEALLAKCWDVLHDARDDVKLIAPSTSPRGNDKPNAVSNISHSPTLFLRELGRAYRESGRDSPIFDVVGHHVHAIHSAERPWRLHRGSSVTQGDLDKLEQALSEGFAGTAQPVPGHCVEGKCVPVWWLEAGFQTKPDRDKASLYSGVEVTPRSLPDSVGPVDLEPLPDARSLAPDQATQLVSAVRLAYCQPYVEALFNFLLWDEPRLAGWQSAPFWVDRTRKGSYEALRDAIRDVHDGDVECDELRRATTRPGGAGGDAPASVSEPAGDDDSPWLLAGVGAAGLLVLAGLVYTRRRRRSSRLEKELGDSR